MPALRKVLMPSTSWDVIIIGAGPAGLMAAIACGEGGLRTLLLDSQKMIGAKLLLSGGGRCNVTNIRVSEKDYQTGGPRTVRNILRAFPSEKTLAFFKDLGVEMVLEEGAKYFPKQQSAKVVLEALLRASQHAGVMIRAGKKVKTISREHETFLLSGEDFKLSAKKLVIATGGLSYPGTGSDGSGYALARSLGHSMVPTAPALTSLTTEDADWKTLAGITLPVKISLIADGKKSAGSEGALLFTHQGFSGPAVLDISGPWLRSREERKTLNVNFFPGEKEADIFASWERQVSEHPERSWKRSLARHFPERLAEVLLKKWGIPPASRIDQVSKKERESFLRSLSQYPVPVTGSQGYEKAEVTAGGVDLRDVDAKTLESQLCPGLYFAGEILDVDGRIGGFNFQWAWSSGTVAGRSIVHTLGSGGSR